MNKESVWWTLVNSCATLITQIKSSIENDTNIFINCKAPIPWESKFLDLTRVAIAQVSSQKTVDRISAAGENDPGRFIMMSKCPPAVRNEYWPDMTCAEFLAQREDLALNNRIVWVYDIENEALLEKWIDFVAQYSRLSANHDHAVFILQYNSTGSTPKPPSCINNLSFNPTYFDSYIFALSMLSELDVQFSVKQYVAELACCLSKGDVELCGRLIESGLKLAQAPLLCVEEAMRYCHSDATPFKTIDTDEIYSCVLMAQIKIIFPVIEQFRLNFVKTHVDVLNANLPIYNSFNVKIEEPNELELSDMYQMSRLYNSGISDAESSDLLYYRNMRNKLAHNDTMSWAEVGKILKY